jgi:hypothetical protein
VDTSSPTHDAFLELVRHGWASPRDASRERACNVREPTRQAYIKTGTNGRRRRKRMMPARNRKFADSPLEEAVMSELVSEAEIPC